MEIAVLVFLSSGLFLGWSLGANDAANVFGTAVGSRMVRFSTAAVICAVFVILGAVVSGAGATQGLGKLGAINALPGAFMVALSAAVAVYWMTRAGLPVAAGRLLAAFSRQKRQPGFEPSRSRGPGRRPPRAVGKPNSYVRCRGTRPPKAWRQSWRPAVVRKIPFAA